MRNLLVITLGIAAVSLPAAVVSAPAAKDDPIETFGTCARTNYEGAELLATQPGSIEEKEVLAEFGRRGCAPPDVNAGILRGAVAEQLFKSDFGAIGARPRRELIEVFTVSADELPELDETSRKRIDYVAFGTCVAALAPDASTRLLNTAVASPQEKAVLTEMVGDFSSCLDQGENSIFSRADLRSALAEGAYRLALSQSLDEEVVVTGTRDPSRSVSCKLQNAAGTRLRRNVCLTQLQWADRARDSEYAAENVKRQTIEREEILMAIENMQRAPSAR